MTSVAIIRHCPVCRSEVRHVGLVSAGLLADAERRIAELERQLAVCTCPAGFGQVKDANCPRCNPQPAHMISGAA